MASLFPTFSVPSTLATTTTETDIYKPSLAFNVETGEFITDGTGAILYGSGFDEWVLWCCKMLSTERWAHKAYPNFIGVELDSAFKEPDRASQESAISRTITEALLADPRGRTVRVYDFVFYWAPDTSTVSFTILGRNGDTASVSGKL